MSTATALKQPEGYYDAAGDKVLCQICGSAEHFIPKHLANAHPGVTEQKYKADYPEAPTKSKTFEEAAARRAAERRAQDEASQKMAAKVLPFTQPGTTVKKPMFEVFDMPLTDELRSPPKRGASQGDPIQIDVMQNLDVSDAEAVPAIDDSYVFRAEELKDAVMAVQLNFPLLAWGMHGTGKTSLVEQICARLHRPWVRVQHTDTTEEAHIIGQMVVRNGGTEFDYGPLAEAMMRGWVYVADEYDFAHPAVIAVYQPILEGKPLYIKEAPPHQRLVKPHPNFRFIATGNTNGSGDDTGLYSGTKIGNAAAYSRFGVTIQVHYPETKTEIEILKQRVGVSQDVAEKMVDFASRIRQMYGNGELSLPISPRESIRATMIGMIKGGAFRKGIELAYANRLDSTQAEAVRQTAQRIFG
ncbi:cobaltochelatase CobS [Sphingomonas sp. NFR04]|uniref:AAA family ATPase n=1 Tax=Sphingomonas sp. NFR04 TaxID=1566283 RepID=UPI0008DF44A2|nr:MoxR family ATPase [Sphingomonas sp. NFR04]SFJ49967.1 cobaltochelatase CobS [Sphingomonas sp. NFR04]